MTVPLFPRFSALPWWSLWPLLPILSDLPTPYKLIRGKAIDKEISVYLTDQREARRFKQKMTQIGVTRTKLTIKSLPDHPILVIKKGVLRTMGSKSTFAYFSLTRKVGRRRHNTKRNTVGYRQKRKSWSAVGPPGPRANHAGPGNRGDGHSSPSSYRPLSMRRTRVATLRGDR